MAKHLLLLLCLLAVTTVGHSQVRHLRVSDGLPTGEVQQIVELPNGQMLVNCEGVFCLSTGAGFQVTVCESGRCYTLPHYSNSYGQLWQGDSLLWLRDFYRVYLFDVRTQSFRYDIAFRLRDPLLERFVSTDLGATLPTAAQQHVMDSLQLSAGSTCALTDRQGGLWIGTRSDGIYYICPKRNLARTRSDAFLLADQARSYRDSQGRTWRCKTTGAECEQTDGQATVVTLLNVQNVKGLPYNRTTFIRELPDGRYLLCDSLSTLGYLLPEAREFVSLSKKLRQLENYRHFVGACPIDKQWTVVYAQNGIFLLDTQADTLAPFPGADRMERYATKYNCMVRDHSGTLWIGTQNGLFAASTDRHELTRIIGLRNNCIRSLVADTQGRIWAGTACGISRITPSVINLGEEDGVPTVSMMERAACQRADGSLVFAINATRVVSFSPDSLIAPGSPMPVVITSVKAGGEERGLNQRSFGTEENQVVLLFSTLDYATPSHGRYRYRLLPIEQQWHECSDGNGQATAIYSALSPGHYHFEAQAAAPSGAWGETTATDFTIRPPMWLTWWAKLCYLLMALIIFGTLASFYLRRRRQNMERETDERVNRLFELRDEARHQFAQSANIDPEKITQNKDEERLVERLLKAIGQHMDDADYTVDLLAADVAMSRSSLYKKMQSMLGITPNEFMRNVRLKHAARLLAETNTPVGQVALMVGFQTPRYFSQCFRQLFGVLPSDYRSGGEEEAEDTASSPQDL